MLRNRDYDLTANKNLATLLLTSGIAIPQTRIAIASVNPLPLAQRPQTDEPDLPLHLRLNGLSREPNLPANPRPVTHVELAKAIELQCESIRAQMIEQSGLQARDHGIDDVLSPSRPTRLDLLDLLACSSNSFRRRVSMQSNTAAVENQPVNFPNFPIEKKPYKSDHFTISDGRCIGKRRVCRPE
jgi:hypothetical protein